MTDYTTPQYFNDAQAPQVQVQQSGKVTILEVLAEETNAISPNRSNASTAPRELDADDQ